MVKIPAGSFLMGSPAGTSYADESEFPCHRVNINLPFYLGKYSITQAQWEVVMNSEPWLKYEQKFWGDRKPVIGVSWHDAKEFCKRLSSKTQKTFNLPSEAQWEYACRGIQNAKFKSEKYYFGDNDGKLKDYAWYSYNSGRTIHEVGQKKPNNFGLYDMLGNVWEWCEDNWHENYNNAPNNGSIWLDKQNKYIILLRGGSWVNPCSHCRCALRVRQNLDKSDSYVGFRVFCFS